jgi:hypothetical protein
MKDLITSAEQLEKFLRSVTSKSIDAARKEFSSLRENALNQIREQEEAEEETEEELEAEFEEEAEPEEAEEEETEEETEEVDVESEKDPMERPTASDRAPKRPESGSEVTLSNILYDINQIRSGRSLKDPDVKGNLSDYFERLSNPQRIALSEFLQGLTDVIVKGVPGDDAEDPNDEVKMSETDPEAETEEVEAEAEVEEKVVEKPAEDTTPPIQVRR